jgi:hypothetical protein
VRRSRAVRAGLDYGVRGLAWLAKWDRESDYTMERLCRRLKPAQNLYACAFGTTEVRIVRRKVAQSVF